MLVYVCAECCTIAQCVPHTQSHSVSDSVRLSLCLLCLCLSVYVRTLAHTVCLCYLCLWFSVGSALFGMLVPSVCSAGYARLSLCVSLRGCHASCLLLFFVLCLSVRHRFDYQMRQIRFLSICWLTAQRPTRSTVHFSSD